MVNGRKEVMIIVILGVLVHVLLLQAAFDIYFSSPIDHGMTSIKSTTKPPANRVVFFVADGLRAEAIFDRYHKLDAPNLNKIKDTRGSWGIAHTRVPTESRPGHVALLGGIYEDPAAILKGWKVNPVDFDSVINQSTNAYCWGGPSIINMFSKYNSLNINLYSYDSSLEDFGNNNTIGLDSWVFEKVEEFLEDCLYNCKDFRESGNFFFLHLLGTDTAGHAFKPESEEYKKNIKYVDQMIPRIEQLFEEIFTDKSTAYVFTADHGMTNWGSHGAGSDHETKTPLIAWGAGINIDQRQNDVQQIDIAPLLSALIGLNYPINSVGKLPYTYINSSEDIVAEMTLSNVLQLLEIFNIKRKRRMKNALHFVPYQGITSEDLPEMITYLEYLAQDRQFDQFYKETESFMDFLIQGSDYYHNYYQLPVLIAVTVGIVAWIIYLATFTVDVPDQSQFNVYSHTSICIQLFVFTPLYVNVIVLVAMQEMPFMYYIYFIFPIFMAHILLFRYSHILEAMRSVGRYGLLSATGRVLIYLLGLELLVQGFRYRAAYSLVMLVVAASVFYSKSLRTHLERPQKFRWVCLCLALASFPLLPVMDTTFNVPAYLIGYVIWWSLERMIPDPIIPRKSVTLQFWIFKLTPLYTLAVEYGFIPSDSPVKSIAWILALFPIFLVTFSSKHIITRLISIFIGFGPFYLMVTTNYEVLFLIIYVYLLYYWLAHESQCFRVIMFTRIGFDSRLQVSREHKTDDFLRAFFFVVFIFIGFFGTGNIASLNSFDPMWVRCFLTVFSPFKMAGIILFRIMVPFIFASCVFRAITYFSSSTTLDLFCIVMMFSDLIMLVLLYSIRNIGSWLEIGMSLSQFIIMESFTILMLLLYGVAFLLTNFRLT